MTDSNKKSDHPRLTFSALLYALSALGAGSGMAALIVYWPTGTGFLMFLAAGMILMALMAAVAGVALIIEMMTDREDNRLP